MNKRDKLLILGILVLGGAAAYKLLQPVEAPVQNVAKVAPMTDEEYQRKWAKLDGDVPPGIEKAAGYLEQRFGHLGEVPTVGAGVDGDGSNYFIAKRAIVGRDGNGKKVYAQGIMRPHKFTGPVFKKGDNPAKIAASIKLEGQALGQGAASRPAHTIPIEDVPGIGDKGKRQ